MNLTTYGNSMEKTAAERQVEGMHGSLMIKVLVRGEEIIGIRNEPCFSWWCKVYRAGLNERCLCTVETFPVELDLVSDRYDLKVHFNGVEMWLHGVFIEKRKTTSITLTI